MVVHTDINLLSVIEYALKHLKVRDIIVCGHYVSTFAQSDLKRAVAVLPPRCRTRTMGSWKTGRLSYTFSYVLAGFKISEMVSLATTLTYTSCEIAQG